MSILSSMLDATVRGHVPSPRLRFEDFRVNPSIPKAGAAPFKFLGALLEQKF